GVVPLRGPRKLVPTGTVRGRVVGDGVRPEPSVGEHRHGPAADVAGVLLGHLLERRLPAGEGRDLRREGARAVALPGLVRGVAVVLSEPPVVAQPYDEEAPP